MENEGNNPSTSTDSWVGKGATSGLEGTQADRDRNTAGMHPDGEGTASGVSGMHSETDRGGSGLSAELGQPRMGNDATTGMGSDPSGKQSAVSGSAAGMTGKTDDGTSSAAFNTWETSTNPMIASNRVEGTAVYNSERERLGTIQHIMIDKLSGQSEFAVMSFGGFLGIGSDYYPIPWNKLSYDTEAGGYVVDLTQDQLTSAPRHGEDENPDYNADYTGEIGRYYGL